MPFVGNPRQNMPNGILVTLKDDCELVDITGRIIRNDKAGHIDHKQQAILQSLCLSYEQWLTLTTEFEKHSCYAAGEEIMIMSLQCIQGINVFKAWAKTLLRCA